jgi:hypothetical protein
MSTRDWVVQRMQRTQGAFLALIVMLVVAGGAFSSCANTGSDVAGETDGRVPGPVIAHGDDRLPNTTVADWVTYADHVVQVTVTGEKEVAPSPGEVEVGEGVIMRNLTLDVDKVLWSSSDAKRKAPKSFPWLAFGWAFKGDPDDAVARTKMVGDDAPRLELGRTYIMAIEWEPAYCPDGDEPVPAMWRGLGSDAVVPFSGSVIGTGEFMGEQVEAAVVAKSLDPMSPSYSFEDAMTGQNAAALTAALDSAKPEREEDFSSGAPLC